MSSKARFLLVIVLVVAFTQILWAQLPQTFEEMEQGNTTGVSQGFATLNTLVGSLQTYSKNHLKDQSAEVQINSVLAIGVLLGGRADFKALAFKPANPEFQNMFSISRTVLEKFSRQFVLLSPEVNNDQLKALSDKVHDMIE